MGFPRNRGLALVALAALAAAACAATTSGQPHPGPTPADLSALDTGPFQAAPFDFRPRLQTKDDVFHIEARRMMGYLLSPHEVDPQLNQLDDARIVDETSFGEQPYAPLPEQYGAVATRHHLICGALVTRTNNKSRERKTMTIVLLRFPSADEARAAAMEFAATPLNDRTDRHDIALPDIAGASAWSNTDVKGFAFAAHGDYAVLSLAAVPRPDPNALAAQFETMFRAQFARLEQLTPTPVDDILDLPSATEPLMRLALPLSKKAGTSFSLFDATIGIYTPAGELHFERDATVAGRAFTDAGVDLVAHNDGIVYRTRDFDSAVKLQTALTAPGRNDDEIDPPHGITDAHCLALADPEPIRHDSYLCAVAVGRYVGVVGEEYAFGERMAPTFYQRVAAQYAILARAERM
ncbi:DUF7373 family lipoprotein [Nocardia arthritidis]|uniref:Uncharacterized protein n=1 Tax=Nocardia arthritidis TaxID=228602 RepID=A0A6G9YD15_9NOCA|nr:hypothetical protein [Nocardia arthritidis]QIS11092.1 hypothetical protein F5544_16060 [Nocardia arthritidis]